MEKGVGMVLSCLAKRKWPGGCQNQETMNFAARTIPKVMLSDLDNAESQVQGKARHLGSWWKLL